ALFYPQAAQIPGDQLPTIHASEAISLMPIKPRTIVITLILMEFWALDTHSPGNERGARLAGSSSYSPGVSYGDSARGNLGLWRDPSHGWRIAVGGMVRPNNRRGRASANHAVGQLAHIM